MSIKQDFERLKLIQREAQALVDRYDRGEVPWAQITYLKAALSGTSSDDAQACPECSLLEGEIIHHANKLNDACLEGNLDLFEELVADIFNYARKGWEQVQAARAIEQGQKRVGGE